MYSTVWSISGFFSIQCKYLNKIIRKINETDSRSILNRKKKRLNQNAVLNVIKRDCNWNVYHQWFLNTCQFQGASRTSLLSVPWLLDLEIGVWFLLWPEVSVPWPTILCSCVTASPQRKLLILSTLPHQPAHICIKISKRVEESSAGLCAPVSASHLVLFLSPGSELSTSQESPSKKCAAVRAAG